MNVLIFAFIKLGWNNLGGIKKTTMKENYSEMGPELLL
jgi:hypothetical protein